LGKRIKFKITPSESVANLLTVEEAMQQILDYVSILKGADDSLDDKENRIVWKLVEATTNSPFTLTVEAYATDANVSVDARANEVTQIFRRGMESVITKGEIPAWLEKKTLMGTPLQNVLKRNMNGIGRTDIELGDNIRPIMISHRTADTGIKNIALSELKEETQDFTHVAYGTIEGQIRNVNTYYNKPSFTIQDRLTNQEARCVVQSDLAVKIGPEHTLEEVWGNQRVIVEGNISYNRDGDIVNIDAVDVRIVHAESIRAESFLDPNYTGGKAVSAYLEDLREGKGG